MDGNSNTTRERDEFLTPIEKVRQQKKVLPAVSTSLALATGIGLLEMVALIVGSGTLINIIGFTNASTSRTVSDTEGTL
uniref:Uncharacterized protein n=1 Tax=Zea mays TaxID=4577 RepID=A0A804PRK1_MAIZE